MVRMGGGGTASPIGKIDPDIVFPEFGTGSGLRPVVTDLNAEKAHAFLVFLNQTKKNTFNIRNTGYYYSYFNIFTFPRY